ncbi:MAG: ABC transporter permease [Candidatus Thermoplasmatota archaeon]|nr:ABC transporter permease [Candidatus Thermoplasmatota archaeon]MBU1940376.1 ABC transporter permease [Candidatus Thermoplasmatota archaeon]
MLPFNPKAIYSLAKKEFTDNVRNRWIIFLTILFAVLVVVFSYLAGSQTSGDAVLGNFQNTVLGLVSISSILIPLIAIILGFSTISGEIETGALSVLLTYPIRRLDVYLGKLFGLLFVLMFTIFIGFGFGGLFIIASAGADKIGPYIIFILLSIVLGLIYISLMLLISSFTKRRITSIAGGIVMFFWSMIIGSVILGVYLSSGYSFADLQTGVIPDWFWNSVILSPMDLHQTVVTMAFDITEFNTAGFSIAFPDFLNMNFLLGIHFLWIIIPAVLGYLLFRRRDI